MEIHGCATSRFARRLSDRTILRHMARNLGAPLSSGLGLQAQLSGKDGAMVGRGCGLFARGLLTRTSRCTSCSRMRRYRVSLLAEFRVSTCKAVRRVAGYGGQIVSIAQTASGADVMYDFQCEGRRLGGAASLKPRSQHTELSPGRTVAVRYDPLNPNQSKLSFQSQNE